LPGFSAVGLPAGAKRIFLGFDAPRLLHQTRGPRLDLPRPGNERGARRGDLVSPLGTGRVGVPQKNPRVRAVFSPEAARSSTKVTLGRTPGNEGGAGQTDGPPAPAFSGAPVSSGGVCPAVFPNKKKKHVCRPQRIQEAVVGGFRGLGPRQRGENPNLGPPALGADRESAA